MAGPPAAAAAPLARAAVPAHPARPQHAWAAKSSLSTSHTGCSAPCRRSDMVEHFGLKLDGYFFTGARLALGPFLFVPLLGLRQREKGSGQRHEVACHAAAQVAKRSEQSGVGRPRGPARPTNAHARQRAPTRARHPHLPRRARLGAELRLALHAPAYRCGGHHPPRGELSLVLLAWWLSASGASVLPLELPSAAACASTPPPSPSRSAPSPSDSSLFSPFPNSP